MPMVPPAATEPVASLSSYPIRFISGMAIRPIVAAVAILEALTAANPADAPIVAMATPPNTAITGKTEAFSGTQQRSTEARQPSAAPIDLRAGALRTFIHEMDLLQARVLTRAVVADPLKPLDTLV